MGDRKRESKSATDTRVGLDMADGHCDSSRPGHRGSLE